MPVLHNFVSPKPPAADPTQVGSAEWNDGHAVNIVNADVDPAAGIVESKLSLNFPTHAAVTIGTANGLSLAGQALSLGLASAGVAGALSGADWTTFNSKQNALGFTPLNPANNLSDLANVVTARTNLGLGAAALLAVPITAANGGTGVVNGASATLTLPNAATVITGGGTIALGGFTLTIPASLTAAGLAIANVFTRGQFIDGSADEVQLRIQGHSTQTANALAIENSSGTVLARITGAGAIGRTVSGQSFIGWALEIIESSTSKMWINDGVLNITRSDGAGFRITSSSGGNKSWDFITSDVVADQPFGANWSKIASPTETADKGFMLRGLRATAGSPSLDGRPLLFPTAFHSGGSEKTEGFQFRALRNSSTTGDYYLALSNNLGASATMTDRVRFGYNGNVSILSTQALALTIGAGTAGIDYQLKFDGETNDGLLTWMEDEDYFQFEDDVFVNDAENIVLGTSTGTKIGTGTTQKLGFWNATPIVQPTGAAQAAPAAYVTGAFGLDSDAHMQALYDLVVAMRTALVNSGIMKGSA